MMQLELSLRPHVLPDDALADIRWRVTLKNTSDAPLAVFPRAAQFDVASGWPGPFWRLEVHPPGAPHVQLLRELRTWYGPPPMPPPQSFFTSQEKRLKPGDSCQHLWAACWIPNRLLPAKQLTLRALDPEGHDGLARLDADLARCHAMVLGTPCKAMKQALKAGEPVLRPAKVIFLPGKGVYTVTLTYSQARDCGSYRLPSAVEATAAPATLEVP